MRYSALLAHVHRRLAQAWDVPADPAAGAAFGDSVKDWPAFPDSPAALQYLVDRASFAHSERRLGVEFTAIHTAEDIGSYKPDPRNFRYLIEELERAGHQKGEILHTAQSLFHDHGPANRCGLASAWIDRGRGTEGGGATMRPDPGVRYDFRFPDMAAMAAAHRAETAQR
jgi:2-haloalkanoic acid dehalogenase type II